MALESIRRRRILFWGFLVIALKSNYLGLYIKESSGFKEKVFEGLRIVIVIVGNSS